MEGLRLAGLLLTMVCATQAHATTYRLTNLGTLGGTLSYANGINASGQVVGLSNIDGDSAQHAFISAPNGGPLTDLGTLGGNDSQAYGINDAGQAVGYAFDTGNSSVSAFISANGGPMSPVAPPFSHAYAINASGQVVGDAFVAGAGVRAYITAPNGGAVRILGTLSGGTESLALGVNASGQAVGYSVGFIDVGGDLVSTTNAFMSAPDGGALTDLGTLGGKVSLAYGVNDLGQAVGVSTVDAENVVYHAFVSAANGGPLSDLGTLDGRAASWAMGINNHGQVVGYSSGPGFLESAFVTDPDSGAMVDLNNLIDPDDPLNGLFALTGANAINDAGQIAGIGFSYLDGQYRAYLATPVPAPVPLPTGLWLLGSALGIGGLLRRRAA